MLASHGGRRARKSETARNSDSMGGGGYDQPLQACYPHDLSLFIRTPRMTVSDAIDTHYLCMIW
jgi:hypothetical protein